jgi:hypothetical protein
MHDEAARKAMKKRRGMKNKRDSSIRTFIAPRSCGVEKDEHGTERVKLEHPCRHRYRQTLAMIYRPGPRPRTPGVDLARVSLPQKHLSCNFTYTSNDKITPSPSERTPAALMRPQCLSARRRRTRADCSRARCGLGDTTHGWYGSSDEVQNQRQQLTDSRGAPHLRVRRGDLLLAPRLR